MAMHVMENEPLLKELRELLITEDRKKTNKGQERIAILQSEIQDNIRNHIGKLKQHTSMLTMDLPVKPRVTTKSKEYKELIIMYREAKEMMSIITELKRSIRGRKQ